MPTSLDLSTIYCELDALQAKYGPRILLGLSGGGDSMALAHLCAGWAKGNDAIVSALCIDHGFRPESATEAQQACAWANALGLHASVYTNVLPAPQTGLQDFARKLRQTIFAKTAFEIGCGVVLVGHTQDDQAETIAFRLARQTGLDGLAGMAKVTTDLLVWQGQTIPLARPLLSVSRASLRDYLRNVGQAWIEDPSNQNTDFSRIKVRNRLAVLAETGNGQAERLCRIGEQARYLREQLNEQARDLSVMCRLETHGAVHTLEAEPFFAAQRVVQARVLSWQLGDGKPKDTQKLDRLLDAMAQDGFKSATLGGVLVRLNKGRFHFTPEPPRKSPPLVGSEAMTQ
jgi:tRNA(Ile)-lysidine synthase